MIKLTSLNNKEFYLNCDLIERIEVTPDTIVSTTTDKKYVVKESPNLIIKRIIEYKRQCASKLPEVTENEEE